MARNNTKLLVFCTLTVFTLLLVFFLVTNNQQSPKDEIVINYLKEIQKGLQDQKVKSRLIEERVMRMKQPSTTQKKKMEEEESVMKKNIAEEDRDPITTTIYKGNLKYGETKKVKNFAPNKGEDRNQENPTDLSIRKVMKKNRTIKEELNKFTKVILQQMESMKKTFQNLPQWKDREDLNRKLSEIHSSTLPSPYVTRDDIIHDCKTEYDVFILATSHAGNFQRRAWIRDTWGASKTWLTKKNWKVVFNLGTHEDPVIRAKVEAESKQFKDVLELDIPDTFYKLPHRVMAGLQWAYQRSKFKYLLKTDDDVFIHVDRVITKLEDEKWAQEDYIGRMLYKSEVMRWGKYAVTKEEWPEETFHPFCSGGGFFLSNSIIGKMIPHYDWVKPFKLDDVYIGLLVKLAGE